MKLYVNNKGQWAGTQAEAKKIGAKVTEVPTDKPGLLAFLNGQQQTPLPDPEPQVVPRVRKQHIQHELFDVADRASLQDLQAVVYRYLMKVDDELDLKKPKQ